MAQTTEIEWTDATWNPVTGCTLRPKSNGRKLEGVEHNAMPVYLTEGGDVVEFRWHPSDPPPLIEEHSKAKLAVLRSYLCAYFDRLNIKPGQEQFKLNLVDGFAGGGGFQYRDRTLSGTSFIMLEEVAKATEQLNRGQTKPPHFNCKFYFVDKEQAHTDYL